MNRMNVFTLPQSARLIALIVLSFLLPLILSSCAERGNQNPVEASTSQSTKILSESISTNGIGVDVQQGVRIGSPDASVTLKQVIQVVDKSTGKALPGVRIAVCDNSVCYVPQTTGTNGSATFSTRNGLRTIFVSRSGYASYCVTPMSCFTSYKISLSPMPAKPKSSSLLSTSVAISADVLALAKAIGVVKYVGRFSLGQINVALEFAHVVDLDVCILSPAGETPPCWVADVVLFGASAASFLAGKLGVPESQLFDFYSANLGTPQVIMIPVR